jgi:hypothetical protein
MDWNLVTAIAASVAALAAIASVFVLSWQVKQEARLTRYAVGIETLLRFEDKWDQLSNVRAKAAIELKAGKPGRCVVQVIDFFDAIGKLSKQGVLDKDLVWHMFYWPMANYWAVCQDFVRETQHEQGSATWEDYSEIMSEIRATESKRSKRNLAEIGPSKDQIAEFMEDEKARLSRPQ